MKKLLKFEAEVSGRESKSKPWSSHSNGLPIQLVSDLLLNSTLQAQVWVNLNQRINFFTNTNFKHSVLHLIHYKTYKGKNSFRAVGTVAVESPFETKSDSKEGYTLHIYHDDDTQYKNQKLTSRKTLHAGRPRASVIGYTRVKKKEREKVTKYCVVVAAAEGCEKLGRELELRCATKPRRIETIDCGGATTTLW